MPAIDPQIIGVEDDGSDVGAIRTKIARGDIVVMPFRGTHEAVEQVGAGSGWAYQEGLLGESEAGFGTGYTGTVAAFATTGNGIRLLITFYGSSFGLHFRRQTTTPLDLICLGVDGMYWPVKGYHEYLTSRGFSTTDGASLAMVVDNLPPVPKGRSHIGEIIAVCAPSGTTTTAFFGFLVDKSAGYSPPPRLLFPVTTTLTTSDVAFFKGTSGPAKTRAIRKVGYYNRDTVTRSVVIKLGATIIARLSIPTLGYAEYDPGALAATPITVTHAAGEADTVNPVQATSWVGV